MEDFAATYANMSDDDLTRLHADRASLLSEAAIALDSEYQKRQLDSCSEQPLATNDEPREKSAGLSWWARLIVFLVWGIAASTICLYFINAHFSAEAQGKLAENIGAMLFYSVLFLTGASSFVKKYLNVTRTMLLAAIFYSLGIGALAVAGAFNPR
jgi:cation transport ATPase